MEDREGGEEGEGEGRERKLGRVRREARHENEVKEEV